MIPNRSGPMNEPLQKLAPVAMPRLSVCPLDARVFQTQRAFLIIEYVLSMKAHIPPEENVVILVDYSFLDLELQAVWSKIFLRGVEGFTVAACVNEDGIALAANCAVLYKGSGIASGSLKVYSMDPIRLPEADTTIPVFDLGPQCLLCSIQLSAASTQLGTAPEPRPRRIGFMWCPGFVYGMAGLLPNDKKLNCAMGLVYSQMCCHLHYHAYPVESEMKINIVEAQAAFWASHDALVFAVNIRDTADNPCCMHMFKGAGKVYAGWGTYDGSTWVPDASAASQGPKVTSGQAWYRIRSRENVKSFPALFDLNPVLVLCRGPAEPLHKDVLAQDDIVPVLNETEYEPLCIICMDHRPSFLFQACGHLCLCKKCRKMIYLKEVKPKKTRTLQEWNILYGKQRKCPMCNQSSTCVCCETYKGNIYEC